jgi:membrane protein
MPEVQADAESDKSERDVVAGPAVRGPAAEGAVENNPQARSTSFLPDGGVLSSIWYFIMRMDEGEVLRVAASLSFTTILQIVPTCALLLALLTAFPGFADLKASVQDFILSNLVPDVGVKMTEQFAAFLEAAGKLTAFGGLGLAVTTLMLLLTIENSFNAIFKVVRHRSWRMRLLVLWAVITVAPFLIAVSFTLYGYFGASSNPVPTPLATALTFILGLIMPIVLAWGGLTFLYVVVPNRHVPFLDAMAGAAFATVVLTALRWSFATYVKSMTSYEAVYGALAAVPIFLVWIYFLWMAVMAGAVITASLPDWRYSRSGASDTPIGRIALALDVIAKLAVAQDVGNALSSRALAKALAVPDVVLMRVIDTLRKGHIIASTDNGAWMLSRDLDRLALGDIVHMFGVGLDFPHMAATTPSQKSLMGRRLASYLQRAAETERTSLSVTLAKIVSEPVKDTAASIQRIAQSVADK